MIFPIYNMEISVTTLSIKNWATLDGFFSRYSLQKIFDNNLSTWHSLIFLTVWNEMLEMVPFDICTQLRLRSACASVESERSHCCKHNFCTLGNFACFLSSLDFFLKINFFKKSFRNTIRVSNSLDPDQDQNFVGPDLGPNCLQRLSADDKSRH